MDILHDLLPMGPEIFIALAAMALLLFGVFHGDKGALSTIYLAQLALAVTALLMFFEPVDGLMFRSMVIIDDYGRFIKFVLLAATSVSLMLSLSYLHRTKSLRPEYPVLMLLAMLGMMLMVSAHDLMALYVGLELQSLALYVLATFRRDLSSSSEAGLKYFVLGALASCLFLYGASLIYGYVGATDFEALAISFKEATPPVGAIVGLVFVVAGLSFKISAVPFHMWTPDVYEGAPTPITAYFAVAPKLAALALLTRVLCVPMEAMVHDWQQIIVFLAVASMTLGAVAGLMQTNIKRLMAYSSITNVGFMLVGLAVNDASGIQAWLVYMILYAISTFGAFAVILCLRRKEKAVLRLHDLAGLSKSHPLLAASMAIFMFSLAGVPPLAGFFGKYFVLLAAVKGGLTFLAIIGVLMSVVAAFYYLRVVKIMYFDENTAGEIDAVHEYSLRAVMIFAGAALLFLVIDPDALLLPTMSAAKNLLNL